MPSSFYHNGFQSNLIWIHKFYGGLIGYNLSIYMQVITRLNSIAYKEIFLIDEKTSIIAKRIKQFSLSVKKPQLLVKYL